MKATLLKLHNFIQREFVADSRQYFDSKFYYAFESIPFNKNQITHWNNKNELKFLSLVTQHPFIEDLILYRKKINSLDEYCDISYDIITDFFNRLRKENILYTDGFLETKQEVFANNVVKDKRRDFYRDMKTIFNLIEMSYSEELKSKCPQKSPIIRKQNEVFELLRENNILDENFKWIPDKKNHKKKFITVLIFKLITLKLVEYKNYKIFQKKFEKLIDCEFDYNKSTGIITSFEEENADDNSVLFFDSLTFLDSIGIK